MYKRIHKYAEKVYTYYTYTYDIFIYIVIPSDLNLMMKYLILNG